MRTEVERFRSAVVRSFGGRPGRGARYSEELQREAVSLTASGMASGESLAAMSRALGVRAATLGRWLERVGRREPLRRVEVVREEASEAARPSRLVLVTPAGIRIEGLRVEDVPELLRVLG